MGQLPDLRLVADLLSKRLPGLLIAPGDLRSTTRLDGETRLICCPPALTLGGTFKGSAMAITSKIETHAGDMSHKEEILMASLMKGCGLRYEGVRRAGGQKPTFTDPRTR